MEMRAAILQCGFAASAEDMARTEQWVCDEFGSLAANPDLIPNDQAAAREMKALLDEMRAMWSVLHASAMDHLYFDGIYDITAACRAAALSTLVLRVEAAIKSFTHQHAA